MNGGSGFAVSTASLPGDGPVAVIDGGKAAVIPEELYVPPDALVVFLKSFEGPLDLLLYLIRRQDFDILDLPMAEIAGQYMNYMEKMQQLQLDTVSDYLVMAAMLAEIKSRALLPRSPADEEEEDPRVELVRRLLEYQRFKDAAERIDILPRTERDFVPVTVEASGVGKEKVRPRVDIEDIVTALQGVLIRAEFRRSHRITREPLSVRERIGQILSLTANGGFVEIGECFTAQEGRGGVVVALLALLELMRSRAIEVIQVSSFGPIRIRRASPAG